MNWRQTGFRHNYIEYCTCWANGLKVRWRTLGAFAGALAHLTYESLVPKFILIVDDSAVIRRAIRSFLQSRPGFEVCGEAADGIEALAKAEELKPDLIVLDFSMPKMNGLEAAAALQKIMPKVPIILYTFHKDAVQALRPTMLVSLQ